MGDSAGWYRVCLNTIVRKSKELDSERLRILPMGSKVYVEEVSGRRVRITQPLKGWCSMQSSNGDTILDKQNSDVPQTPSTAPPKEQPVAALNNLNDKIAAANTAGKETSQLTQDLEARKKTLKAQKEAMDSLKSELEVAATGSFRTGDVVMVKRSDEDKASGTNDGLGIVRYLGPRKDYPSDVIGIEWKTPVGEEGGTIILPNGEEGGFKAPPQHATYRLLADEGAVKLISPQDIFTELVKKMVQMELDKKAVAKEE